MVRFALGGLVRFPNETSEREKQKKKPAAPWPKPLTAAPDWSLVFCFFFFKKEKKKKVK